MATAALLTPVPSVSQKLFDLSRALFFLAQKVLLYHNEHEIQWVDETLKFLYLHTVYLPLNLRAHWGPLNIFCITDILFRYFQALYDVEARHSVLPPLGEMEWRMLHWVIGWHARNYMGDIVYCPKCTQLITTGPCQICDVHELLAYHPVAETSHPPHHTHPTTSTSSS